VIVTERVTGAARTFLERTRIELAPMLGVIACCILLLSLPFVLPLDGHSHADWLQFIGRFHPVLLHLPIGMIVLVPVLEIAGVRRPALREAAGFVLRAALALALPTLALGYMLAFGAGDTGTTVHLHMWGGVVLCIALMACVLAQPAWEASGQRHVYPAMLAATLLTLVWMSHEGGSITHGNDYLTRYMPGRMGRLFASSSASDAHPDSFYSQRIHPVLDAKCVVCHGGSTEKGGLRLDSYDGLMKGGKDGAVVSIGKPEASLLIARVTLPTNDKHFMPAEGRTPLTAEEIAWIRAWIQGGASATATSIAGVNVANNAPEAPPQPVGDYSALMPEIQRMQQGQGAKLVPVSNKPSDGLILRTVDVAPSFGDAQLAGFGKFAPYIVEAELGRTGVTDASFDTLRTFTHLRGLHLEGTAINGSGLAKVSSLTQLTYLNLSNTKVTAQSLAALKNLPHLRHVYLFNTPAQPDDVSARNSQ
jgi:uncharacterized membrane protein